VQWQTTTRDGSISAVNEIAPQWQAPLIFMKNLAKGREL